MFDFDFEVVRSRWSVRGLLPIPHVFTPPGGGVSSEALQDAPQSPPLHCKASMYGMIITSLYHLNHHWCKPATPPVLRVGSSQFSVPALILQAKVWMNVSLKLCWNFSSRLSPPPALAKQRWTRELVCRRRGVGWGLQIESDSEHSAKIIHSNIFCSRNLPSFLPHRRRSVQNLTP